MSIATLLKGYFTFWSLSHEKGSSLFQVGRLNLSFAPRRQIMAMRLVFVRHPLARDLAA